MPGNKHLVANPQGFTLIEIIAVLVLLGILAAVAVPKYMDLTATAKIKAIDGAIAELNSRESLSWAKDKITGAGYVDDVTTFGNVVTAFSGTDYSWTVAPSVTGGTLSFQNGTEVILNRTASTVNSPGNWKRN